MEWTYTPANAAWLRRLGRLAKWLLPDLELEEGPTVLWASDHYRVLARSTLVAPRRTAA